jgi:hypothetical protein
MKNMLHKYSNIVKHNREALGHVSRESYVSALGMRLSSTLVIWQFATCEYSSKNYAVSMRM